MIHCIEAYLCQTIQDAVGKLAGESALFRAIHTFPGQQFSPATELPDDDTALFIQALNLELAPDKARIGSPARKKNQLHCHVRLHCQLIGPVDSQLVSSGDCDLHPDLPFPRFELTLLAILQQLQATFPPGSDQIPAPTTEVLARQGLCQVKLNWHDLRVGEISRDNSHTPRQGWFFTLHIAFSFTLQSKEEEGGLIQAIASTTNMQEVISYAAMEGFPLSIYNNLRGELADRLRLRQIHTLVDLQKMEPDRFNDLLTDSSLAISSTQQETLTQLREIAAIRQTFQGWNAEMPMRADLLKMDASTLLQADLSQYKRSEQAIIALIALPLAKLIISGKQEEIRLGNLLHVKEKV